MFVVGTDMTISGDPSGQSYLYESVSGEKNSFIKLSIGGKNPQRPHH